MKRLVSILCCALSVLTLSAQSGVSSVKKGAHILFESTEYDFGALSRRDENKSCTLRFVNDGTEPLVILSATTTCSCLKVEAPRKPIIVGASGEIRLTLETKKVEKGVFRRIVQVRSNSTGGTEIITIKGIVKD